MEERQRRIKEEQSRGGTGTAYAIAVSHMLKVDPHSSTPSSTGGDNAGKGGKSLKKDRPSSIGGGIFTGGDNSTEADASTGGDSSMECFNSTRGDTSNGGETAAIGTKSNPVRNGASSSSTAAASASVHWLDQSEPARSGPDGRSLPAAVKNGEEGGEGEGGRGGGGEVVAGGRGGGERELEGGGVNRDGGGSDSGSASSGVSGCESDYSDSGDDSDEREGHTRRGWAERRERLRKDGMHGRRLPPPQAEEERAFAKAEKREVRHARWRVGQGVR